MFTFWISHVPLERLDAFLTTVASALRPGGAVFFVDGRREPLSTAVDHQLPAPSEQVMTRRLDDGRPFQIVKNYFEPRSLRDRRRRTGLNVDVRETDTYFLYGAGLRLVDLQGRHGRAEFAHVGDQPGEFLPVGAKVLRDVLHVADHGAFASRPL